MLDNYEFCKSLLEKYPLENVLYPFDELIRTLGLEATYKLMQEFSGTTIYIPCFRKVFKNCIDEEIINSFDGSNYFQLAKKYKLSERSIRTIVDG